MSSVDGNVPDRGPAVFAVTLSTLVLATVFVSARMFCRYFIVKNLTWDDKIMVLAWFLSFGLCFTICFGTSQGLGRHDEDIQGLNESALRRCEYVFSILYVSLLFLAAGARHRTDHPILEPGPDGDQDEHPGLLPALV